MYKYEQRRKSLEPHSSVSVKRKDTIELKCDLPAQPKVNVRKAMGVSENIANKTAFTYKEPQQTIQNNTGHVRRSQKNYFPITIFFIDD